MCNSQNQKSCRQHHNRLHILLVYKEADNMIETISNTTDSTFNCSSSAAETPRRRSTFYVPLVTSDSPSNDNNGETTRHDNSTKISAKHMKRSFDKVSRTNSEWNQQNLVHTRNWNDIDTKCEIKRSLSASITTLSHRNDRVLIDRSMKSNSAIEICQQQNKAKRYGIVLNGSINLDDDDNKLPTNDENQCHDDEQKSPSNTSTPIKMLKSRSRSNILCLPEKSLQLSPLKEKSKTLPQNVSPKVSTTNITTSHSNSITFPPKYSFLLKSPPKKSLNYSFDAVAAATSPIGTSPADKKSQAANALSPTSSSSPRKALSFIRRAHSTKLSRSNSLLKSLTSKCVDDTAEHLKYPVNELLFDRFEECFKSDNFYALIRELFVVKDVGNDCNNGIAHSTTAVSISREHNDNEKSDEDVHSGKYAFQFHSRLGFCLKIAADFR